jgi:hypothetical protein
LRTLGHEADLSRDTHSSADEASIERWREAEAMRYLAELPWVPHAIVANRELEWRELDSAIVEVATRVASARVAVRLHFDAAGDVLGAAADARPRQVGKTTVDTPFSGRFGEPQVVGGLRVPTTGEVAWEQPDGPFTYFRGRLTGLEIDQLLATPDERRPVLAEVKINDELAAAAYLSSPAQRHCIRLHYASWLDLPDAGPYFDLRVVLFRDRGHPLKGARIDCLRRATSPGRDAGAPTGGRSRRAQDRIRRVVAGGRQTPLRAPRVPRPSLATRCSGATRGS